MVGTCIVCRSSPDKLPVILHTLPADDPRRHQWISWIGQQLNRHYVPKDYQKICSRHFKSTDYQYTRAGPRLKRSVVPSINAFFHTVGEKYFAGMLLTGDEPIQGGENSGVNDHVYVHGSTSGAADPEEQPPLFEINLIHKLTGDFRVITKSPSECHSNDEVGKSVSVPSAELCEETPDTQMTRYQDCRPPKKRFKFSDLKDQFPTKKSEAIPINYSEGHPVPVSVKDSLLFLPNPTLQNTQEGTSKHLSNTITFLAQVIAQKRHRISTLERTVENLEAWLSNSTERQVYHSCLDCVLREAKLGHPEAKRITKQILLFCQLLYN